ncbi:MAG: pectate lyase [Bacteroidetes bacterium]|nr:pectate lyase [Bacteroidota bacterium]
MLRTFIASFCLLLFTTSTAQPLAFPEAEGFGKYTRGGRGGEVHFVTNLHDAGPGSLRAALESEGPRTVLFRVSGVIELEKEIRIIHPYITIAGQSAPGDGICIKNYPILIEADEVIIRHLRLRLGDASGEGHDAISGRYVTNVILDHVSASWSIDETMSLYHCDSLTVQWCIISESLHNSKHVKGAHGYGAIWGANHSSYHHNLFAHHSSRNPRFASGSQHTDFRNNVIYNWGFNSAYGGENRQNGKEDRFVFSYINMVGNYFKPGPATQPGEVTHRIVNPSARNPENDYGQWFVEGNYVKGNKTVSKDNWNGGVQPGHGEEYLDLIRADEPFENCMPIRQQAAKKAYKLVLKKAGANLPKRDIIDQRIVGEVKKGTATYEGSSYKKDHEVGQPDRACGIIDHPEEVGGWPDYQSEEAPLDTDKDGMPDSWEEKMGLDKLDGTDRNKINTEGYTQLEVYLNSIKTKP